MKGIIKDSLGHPLCSVYNMANCLPPFPDYLKSLNSSAEVHIDLSKPLKLYLRSTELVFKQAAIYYGEGDLERSFILFMKFSNLVLDQLPKHPEYGRIEFSTQKSKLKELCRKAISKLETLRPKLEKTYSEALELEKVAIAEIERKQCEELALKDDVERLQKLKSEHSAIDSNINQSSDSILLKNTSEYTASVYSLPVALNNIPTLTYGEKAANSTLKSMQERMGISSHIQPSHIPNETSTITVSKKYYSENGEVLRPVHVPQCLISKFLQLAARNTENNLETCGVLAGKLHHDEFTITCLIIPKQVATSDTCAMISEEEIITAQDSLDVMSLGWIHTHPTQRCFLSSVDLHTHMPFQLLMAEAIAIVCAPTQSPNFGIFRLTDPPGLEIITNCQHPSAFHPHPENVTVYRELKGPDSHAQLDHNLPLDVIDLRK